MLYLEEVITVNLDKSRKKWSSEVSAVDWPVLSDLKAYESPTVEAYNVSGVPRIYLIAPNGRIIDKSIRGDRLVNYFKDLSRETK